MQEGKAIHATALSIHGHGVVLIGPSGSGKSDLALRLIDRGALLISDDAVIVERSESGPILRCAPNIQGKLEVRGLGIIAMPFVDAVPLRLCVDLAPTPERLPDAPVMTFAGFDVPFLALSAFEASAPLKVELALRSELRDYEGISQA
jgi:HPr kinase/phosphorylase